MISFHYIIVILVILLIASIPTRLEIKAATYTARLASYTDIHLDIENEGRLRINFTTKEIPISPL